MPLEHYQVLISTDEQSAVTCVILQETGDGLDLLELARTTFGPFDTTSDVSRWIVLKLRELRLFHLR